MLDDISGAAPKVPVVELRSLLGCFMFSGDDVFKKLGVLSGGERNRYAMAKMLVSPVNFLLLDEPTNHLDLRAKDVLLDAIRNFTGTVLFVSHDRYFIDGLATRVFEVEDRRLHIYPGNYEDYLWRKQGGPEKVTEQITNSLTPPPTAQPSKKASDASAAENTGAPHIDSDVWASSEARPLSSGPEPVSVPTVPIKRLNPIKLKQLEDRLHHAEEEIPRLESSIAAAEARLGNFISAEQSQKDAAELENLRAKRTALLAEWEELSLTLEEQQPPKLNAFGEARNDSIWNRAWFQTRRWV